MNNIAIIPARGGSRRIPRKNIKDFLGKPLISYSIETAIKSKLFDKVIVSTDDKEIAKIAQQYGAQTPFLRPKDLADDYTSSTIAVEHTMSFLEEKGFEYDFVCTIYATAPFLDVKYLKEGFEKIKDSKAKFCFSVTSMPFPIQRTFKINQEGRCEMFTPKCFFTRSQDLEEAYQDAGQFYWENRKIKSSEIVFGRDSIPVILPRKLVYDIDTLEDWEEAQLIYNALNSKANINL